MTYRLKKLQLGRNRLVVLDMLDAMTNLTQVCSATLIACGVLSAKLL